MEILGKALYPLATPQKTKIIATTGTKGKTSITRTLAWVLDRYLKEPTLEIDTSRVRLGGDLVLPFDEIMRLYGQRPTITPGRFLYALANQEEPVAVVEASIGCAQYGLGYSHHTVGVFTNVYDDHIGEKPYLRTREDIAKAKSFIFHRIQKGGYAVFNDDDDLVRGRALEIPASRQVTLVACTLNNAIASYPVVVTAENGAIVVKANDDIQWSVPIASVPWLYGGAYEPALRNGLSIVGALYGFFDGTIPDEMKQYLAAYEPEETGGRMVIKDAPDGYKVILDFAHEGMSLTQLGKFARSFKAGPGNKVIGVVRLSGERPNDHIAATAKQFVGVYDTLVIREKESSPLGLESKFGRQKGDVQAMIAAAAKQQQVAYTLADTEKSAMEVAEKEAVRGDVIVVIIDNAKRSLALAKEVFKL